MKRVPDPRMQTWRNAVASVLKGLRTTQGVSQDWLADTVGINQSHWSRIERGIAVLTVDQLHVASYALCTTTEEVMHVAGTIFRCTKT